MPSLLGLDDDTQSSNLLGIPGVAKPQITQPDPDQPDQGAGLADLYQRVSDEMARQQQISADRGLWANGAPTAKGAIDAAQQYGSGLLFGTTAPDAPGFTAFHGSPYDFNAFDTSKIGTGEGAQVYGHGLYFAGNEAVAKGYRDALSQGSDAYTKPYSYEDMLDAAGDPDKIAELQKRGRMYEVGINADAEHFLDWDKPLSEQSQHVQDAIGSVLDAHPEVKKSVDFQSDFLRKPASASAVYQSLANRTDPAYAAQKLQDAGIPGIRYLDQGSRGAGEGTRNTVVFDPNTIAILRKYGIAGLMLGGGAAATQRGNGT
jgi:hypothetical protein